MSRPSYLCLLGSLMTVLLARSLPAQVPATSVSPTESVRMEPSPLEPSTNETNTIETSKIEPSPIATSFSASPLIAMGADIPSHIFIGATLITGWDSNPANVSPNTAGASGFATLNPFIEFVTNAGRVKSVVQYRSINTSYGSQYAWQNMNVLSASVLVDVTERFSWDLNVMGSYGLDSVRFLGSDQTANIGGVAGTGAGPSTYLQNAGTVTHGNANFGVRYRRSVRDSVEVHMGNSYNSYSGLNTISKNTNAGLIFSRDLSQDLGIYTYLRDSYYYGYIHCSSYGAGAGLRWRSTEKTEINLSGGPQVNTAACGSQQGFSYTASIGTQLSGSSQVYLLASRAPTTADISLGVWQKSISAGYQRRVTPRAQAVLNLSYVSNEAMATLPAFHGTSVDFRYQVEFSTSLQGIYNFRGYFSTSDGNQLSRSVATFTLKWTPGANRQPQ
jgi:hypothetical protein